MRFRTLFTIVALAVALSAVDVAATAQGKGQAKSQGKGSGADAGEAKAQGQQRADERAARGQSQGKGQAGARDGASANQGGQAKGRSAAQGSRPTDPPGRARAVAARVRNAPAANPAASRGRPAFTREITVTDAPRSARQFFASNRRPHVIAAGALTRAWVRGVDDDLRMVLVGDEVRMLNERGDLLVQLNETRARDLGAWHVNPIEMHARDGAPSFCRSGAGHPVWGRQWCVDKGFGLGTFQDVHWGRTTTLGDVIFGRRVDTGNLATNALLGLVGNTAFDRLALHAITLGYTEPLVGRWVAEPTGPQLLLVNSGPAPVAELVDVNRDGRADVMMVALRPW